MSSENNMRKRRIIFYNAKELCTNQALYNVRGDVIVFNFWGKQYTTNFNRKKRYCLDDKGWEPMYFPIWQKLVWVFTKKVKKTGSAMTFIEAVRKKGV